MKRKPNNRINHRRYPWEEWLRSENRTLTLVLNRDFEVEPYIMAQQVRNAAQARGIRVSLRVLDDSIVVRIRGDLRTSA